MSFNFEALVGHLYIVSGRAISAPPPGALVEVAPKKAVRGRETDTFFTMVLPSGEASVSTKFYEQMAHLSAERYFNNGGSVTAAMRAVFSSLNQDLIQHNASVGSAGSSKKHYEASMVCAVLRDDDLYLGRVGSGVALLCPPNSNGAGLSADGVEPFPASFSDDDQLFGPPLGVQSEPNIKMARYQVMSGTRLVISDSALADFEMDQLAFAMSAKDIGAALSELEILVVPRAMLMAVEFVPPEVPVAVAAKEGQSTAGLAAAAKAKADGPQVEKPGIFTRIIDGIVMGFRRIIGGIAFALAAVARMLNRLIDGFFPPPETGKRSRLTGPFLAGAALLVPLVVVGLVLFMWLTGTDTSELEECVGEAIQTAELARGVSSSDVVGVLAAWNAVLAKVNDCEQLRANDPTLAALEREGQSIIDQLTYIQRRETRPISAFTNATLTQVVLKGLDMYVLDDRNDLVYRITLTDDGFNMVPNSRQVIPTMRRGGAVNEYVMGDLIDIAWATDGSGLSQGNVLVALDVEGVLVEYSPTFLARGAQRLLGTENWVSPLAMTFWEGRLYVLDPGAGGRGQIWRYEPSGGSYSAAPVEYFTGQTRPNITNAVDFGIDDRGDVYLLLSNGVVAKYRGGEPLNFGYTAFPDGQVFDSAQAMFLNNDPVAPGIYMVSRDTRTIFETSLAGTFFNSYRAYDEDLFASLTGVVADTGQGVIYALSGNSVLAFARTQ